jgi:CHAD domain-containing protein
MAKPLKIKKISPNDRLEKAARRILRRRIKEFYSCWPDPDQVPTPEQLHDLRISGKRLRYSAESLRELYPDRLSLLMGLLKGAQDLLGEIQDCVTQRGVIKAYIARMRRRAPHHAHLDALENIVSEYERRESTLFMQFQETWRGMMMDEFRASLKAMVSRVKKTKRERRARSRNQDAPEPILRVIATLESFSADRTGDEEITAPRA